jgi:ribosomal protein L1
MPNPKVGTVTLDVATAVQQRKKPVRSSSVLTRLVSCMAPSVVACLTEKLQGNLAALIDALIKVSLLPARVVT